jgi:penicillin amidase
VTRNILRWMLRGTLILAAVLVLVALGLGLWVRGRLRASLPRLDGEVRLAGLLEPVTVERDGLGIPTVAGTARGDVARATGFLHAQDRFFQMDLQRRSAAGELAELFGAAALGADRRTRVFRLRAVARRVLASAGPEDRALLESYAEGANAGLADLGAVPPEYLVLRVSPQPWLPEDSVLVLLAMYQTLHDERGVRESNLGVLQDTLPAALAAFLAPRGTPWDAPLRGPAFETPPIPGPEVFRLDGTPAPAPGPPRGGTPAGSNNWVVAGKRTAHGDPIVAGDMHLPLGLPNIWYRASLRWTDAGGEERRAHGVTLPGLPVLVAGSNERVAWAFTNTEGDWTDLVIVETEGTDRYRTPDGPVPFERHEETLRVLGGEDETLEVLVTRWGPIVDRDHLGRPRAMRWTALAEGGVNLLHLGLETADDLDQAMAAAHRAGSPPQNFVAADADGRIGWTVLGRIPRRVGCDGRVPASRADGTCRWDGWLDDAEYPAIADPEEGILWTANARTVNGVWLDRMGDGGYALGARAGHIRDALRGREGLTEADMLELQLDVRALFLEPWRELLLGLLTPAALAADPERAELREIVAAWDGRAAVDATGYRLVRGFRLSAAVTVLGSLTAPCSAADERFSFWSLEQYEGPLWALVTERPPHLLPPEHASWEALLLDAADRTVDELTPDGRPLREATWGERNTVRIRHPLSYGAPLLADWIDLPPTPLPGGTHMPRVQSPGFGASQRMAVSPGREEEGYFHMPGGQSGHPLSPHYRDGHEAWIRGEPTPFLPGPTEHTLRLLP